MKEIAAKERGPYFIFDAQSHKVLASIDTTALKSDAAKSAQERTANSQGQLYSISAMVYLSGAISRAPNADQEFKICREEYRRRLPTAAPAAAVQTAPRHQAPEK